MKLLKLLRPLCLILLGLGLGLCQCRMDPFSTFSHDNGGDVPKVPTVRVPLSDKFYDSNGAVLPLGTAISDGFELSVVPNTPISAIKDMFENKAAEILELSVVGPTGEILADGENIDQSIANGASIELVFTDSSGGSLRITVTGSAEAKAQGELDKLKKEVSKYDNFAPSPSALLSKKKGDPVTLSDLNLTKSDLVEKGKTLDPATQLRFQISSPLDQRKNASDWISLTTTVDVAGTTKQKETDIEYFWNYQPDLDKFTNARSSKTIKELEKLVNRKSSDPKPVVCRDITKFSSDPKPVVCRNSKEIPIFSNEELGYTVPSTLSKVIKIIPFLNDNEDVHPYIWGDIYYFMVVQDKTQLNGVQITVEFVLWKKNKWKYAFSQSSSKTITITACDAPNSKNTCTTNP